MGFISYHGEKEDRYSEVLEYSRARQTEEWKKAEEERICNWLVELTGDGKLSHLNVQELLKLVILQYRSLADKYKSIIDAGELPAGCDAMRLWKDFSIDIVDRHILSFHTIPAEREKHLQVYIDRIFKLSETISAADHIQKMADNTNYRKYYVECFDITWTGRNYYHLIQYISGDKSKNVEEFLDGYKKLSLLLNLYFYQVFRPRDDAWMGQIQAERYAIAELQEQYAKHKHIVLNPALLNNPLYKISEQIKSDSGELESNTPESINDEIAVPQACLDRKLFTSLVEKHGIPNYVAACKMLLECEIPENIKENYNKLIERMPILQDAIDKFDNVYHADLSQFDDYFAPETLTVTETLVQYEVVSPSDEILQDTRENVYQATKKLLLLVNEKIDEIYKYVTIETNAEARALEALMSQDGYVDSELKIRRD